MPETHEDIEQRLDELTRKYQQVQNAEAKAKIITEMQELTRRLKEMNTQ
jgi:hypothetical protein